MRTYNQLRALAIALLLWPFGILAQTSTGIILGTVVDRSGAVIPGAKVTVTEIQTGVQTSMPSNGLGYFEIPFLPPGQYQLAVEQSGFKRFVRDGLTLDTDQKMEIPVSLEPGLVQQTVEVKGETPLLDTTTSAIGQVVDNRGVVDLPISNRNLLQLTGLVAGVLDRGSDVAPATTGAVAFGHWSANGGMTNTNAFMMDGASAQNANMNAASIIPTIDAIEEFKIQTGLMSAEYGRTGGAIINVTTKSGTNALHGTVYEFWKNVSLNANTWVNNHSHQPAPFSNINTFGGSVGGPVVLPKLIDGRNRLFFFANYEGYRDVNPVSTYLTVPTAAERTGDFSQLKTSSGAPIILYDPLTTALVPGSTTKYTRQPFPGNVIPQSRIDPTAAAMMAYYPLPNTTPTNANTQINNFFTDAAGYDSQTEWSARVDDVLTETKRLFVRYSQSAQGGGAANYFPNTLTCDECLVHGNPAGAFSPRGGGSALYVYPKNAVVGYTDTLSTRTVLDLRGSLNREFLQRLPQSGGFDLTSIGLPAALAKAVFYAQFPPTTIANYQGLGTPSNGDYLRRGDTTGAFQGSVTLLHGRHTFKTGGDFRIFRYNELQAYNISPAFTFDQTWTQQNPFATSSTAGWSLGSFLLGTATSGTDAIPAATSVQWFYYAGYFQDDWRLSDRLTLNLGLRYDLETPFTERYNKSSTFSPTGNSALTAAYPGAVGGLVFMGKDISSRYQEPIDWNNFAPRIGAAYKVTSSLVGRAAYGIYYAPFNSYGYTSLNASGVASSAWGANGFGANTSLVTTSNGGLTPANYLHNPFPQGLLQPTGNSLGLLTDAGQIVATTLRNNVVVPYIQQYSAGLEYQLNSYLFAASYVGSHGVHQIVNVPLDQLPVADYQMGSALNTQVPNPFYGLITGGTLSTPTISQGLLLRPFPQFQDVQDQYQSTGNMHYNSLQLRAEHRFSKGFSYLANYTWSKNIGNVGERYWTPLTVQNQYDLRAERSLSPFDTPQEFTVAWVWELPFGRNRIIGGGLPWYANALVSGWHVTGDYNFDSGNPLAITNSVNVVGFGAGSRPNWNGQNPKLSGSNQTPAEWFNTSVFSVPAQYTFGNLGPYSSVLRGPHTNTWNAGFFKDTAITERTRLELRAEFYDFFNHPIWAAPGTTVGTPAFGVVSQKTGNRTGQLAAKFIF
jgi:hypothetical protein